MRKLQRIPATVLYATAEPIPFETDMSDLLSDMWEIARKYGGIGLAANQVGELQRVIIIKAKGFKAEIINPVITKHGKAMMNSDEMCLSCPGVNKIMIRHKQITVEGFNKDWHPVKYKLKGLPACVVQHEIDHLNGINIA